MEKRNDKWIASRRGGNRGCLCADNTYKRECCDGSRWAQGIGQISAVPIEPDEKN